MLGDLCPLHTLAVRITRTLYHAHIPSFLIVYVHYV